MKFLAIGSTKESMSAVPPAMARQLVEATSASVGQQKKTGKILELYWIPGWRRVVVIYESKSAEEVAQILSEHPIGAFMNYEIYPLADYDESVKIMVESFKAAERMMAGPHK